MSRVQPIVWEDEQLQRLISFWLDRPEHRRTIAIFYRWLEEKHPELLKRRFSDPYPQLKEDLRFYIRESDATD